MIRDLQKSNLLHRQALARAKDYLAAERELLSALIEIDRDRTYDLHGHTYLTPYCVGVLGLEEDIAKCLVRVVRKSHSVPELAEAVVKGEVSLYKAKVIASVITPENQAVWLEKASTQSKASLEREVAEASGVTTKQIKLDMTFDSIDRLSRARDLLSSKLDRFASFEEAVDWALEELLHRHDPVEKAKRSRDHSSVEHEVTLRDQETCQWIFPNGSRCKERKWLHRHHVIPKSAGGPDTTENLVTLCSGHHRMVHSKD
jgi:hypothetical protein